MFEKIRERLTYYLSTLALLNAAAFSGFAMAQAELEELLSLLERKQKVYKTSQYLYQHFVKAI